MTNDRARLSLVQPEPGQSRYGALTAALRQRVVDGEWPPGMQGHGLRATFASISEELVSSALLKRMTNHAAAGDVAPGHHVARSEAQLRAGWEAVAHSVEEVALSRRPGLTSGARLQLAHSYPVWYGHDMKPISFVGNSLECLREFPEDARQDAGYQLDQVQRGQQPSDFKPMASVGKGV